jgi:hypothetical protein
MPVIAGFALALSTVLVPVASAATSAVATTTAVVPQTVEEYVRSQFADTPIMIDIARCESRFAQFRADGSVVKNPHSSASGVFQIMASIHAVSAKANLGYDIYTLKGNADYARYLYETQGTVPWNDSKACWGKSGHLATAAK